MRRTLVLSDAVRVAGFSLAMMRPSTNSASRRASVCRSISCSGVKASRASGPRDLSSLLRAAKVRSGLDLSNLSMETAIVMVSASLTVVGLGVGFVFG